MTNAKLNLQTWERSANATSGATVDSTFFLWLSGGLRLGLTNTSTYAKIDSIKLDADTLKTYVGGVAYNAVKAL